MEARTGVSLLIGLSLLSGLPLANFGLAATVKDQPQPSQNTQNLKTICDKNKGLVFEVDENNPKVSYTSGSGSWMTLTYQPDRPSGNNSVELYTTMLNTKFIGVRFQVGKGDPIPDIRDIADMRRPPRPLTPGPSIFELNPWQKAMAVCFIPAQ
jgi:hypothetical protein